VTDYGEKGGEDFLGEAQEIVESFSRSLLGIDSAFKKGRTDPELVNEAFRAIHTLKGLAGIFSAVELGQLAHKLEDLLGEVRLGRTVLGPELLDVLFAAIDVMQGFIGASKSGDTPRDEAALAAISAAIDGVIRGGGKTSNEDYGVDPAIWSVLTEYEEHRLRTNLAAGLSLYRVRSQFDLMTIDQEIEALKDRARQLGEVITYLPTGEVTDRDVLELDLILATGVPEAEVQAALSNPARQIMKIPTVSRGAMQPAAPVTGTPLSAALAPESVGTRPVASDLHFERPGTRVEMKASVRAVRVDIRKLDYLMNGLGEMAILKSSLEALAVRIRANIDSKARRDLARLLHAFDRRLGDMQEGILEMRMVPLSQVFDRLARGVRQTSRELSRDVRLVVTGAETEIDKLLVEELGDPLLHMLRNAIDHGIEALDERARVQKPPTGTIALNAYQKGNHVVIEVEDDGRGIDTARLVQKAVELGSLSTSEADQLSHGEALALMFLPGLSTKSGITELSGRGVGMDVVKTNISRIGGVIDVHSELGIGTKITITLPVTLAIVRALLVRVGSQVFAVPFASVAEVLILETRPRIVEGKEVLSLRGTTLALCRLSQLLRIEGNPSSGKKFVVVAQVGERRLGLVVDEIFGQKDVVIKALGRSLAKVKGFSGATEFDDQRVGLVLDVAAIVEEVWSSTESRTKALSYG
jgi:two-component system chemotaxis sensor kinase CheA